MVFAASQSLREFFRVSLRSARCRCAAYFSIHFSGEYCLETNSGPDDGGKVPAGKLDSKDYAF